MHANLDRVRRRLAREAAMDVDAELERFRERTGSDDVDGFLADLRERRRIPHTLFLELHEEGEVATARLVGVRADKTLILETPAMGATLVAPAGGAPVAPTTGAKYSLLGRLGQGAMGEVHVARDEELLRKVALKRMAPAVAQSPALAARFLVEAQVTAQLDHPYIVPIYGIDVGEGASVGYSMKLVQGRTLGQVLEDARHGTAADEAERLPGRLDIFLKVCDAMEYAHSKRVLHRDLKPDNIMVGRYNEVYVMDWGICRVIGRDDGGDDALVRPAGDGTQFGAIMGTPAYMSPEQAAGDIAALDGRSDVFTLGLILQELCTLAPARSGDTLEVVLDRARRADRDRMIHSSGMPIARELVAIVDKATAPAPERRYPSAAALATDLRRHLRGEAVDARPDGPVVRVARAMARHRLATLAALCGTFLVGALAVIGLLLHREHLVAAAHAREERLAALLAQVSTRADDLDDHFYRFEGLLAGVAGHSVEALIRGGSLDVPVCFTDDFADPAHRPADVAMSPYYGRPMSLEAAVVQLAPGIPRESAAAEARLLASLRSPLQTAVLLSGAENDSHPDAGAGARLLAQGLPIHRAFVTLASGVHVTYPGDGAFPAGYDGRRQPRYLLASGKRGMHWGAPATDRAGTRTLLPISTALWSPSGEQLGVAGIEVSFDYLERELLPLPGAKATYLVDQDGRVVVSWPARAAEAGSPGQPVTLAPLPFPTVVESIARGRHGKLDLPDGTMAVVMPLASLGWSYVVIAASR